MTRWIRSLQTHFLVLAAITVPTAAAQSAVIYVDRDANAAKDGTSWTNAFRQVQSALAIAVAGDEIWVADGFYRADKGVGQTQLDRNSTFTIPNDVAVYGGFDGTEATFGQRAGLYLQTILSGDLQEDDATVGFTDNAYHVVTTASSTDADCRLDGFVVEGGYADGIHPLDSGAGAYVDGDPTFFNVLFQNNRAVADGGGAFVDAFGDPTFEQCLFVNNLAADGAGMHLDFHSDPLLHLCIFQGNQASNDGGGLLLDAHCDPSVLGCLFIENQAQSLGGGMSAQHHSDPKIRNTIFLDNYAGEYGGGFHHYDNTDVRMANCRFIGNDAKLDGGGLYSATVSNNGLVLSNSTFTGNQAGRNGGGMYAQTSPSDCFIELRNCSFSKNRAQIDGGGIYYAPSTGTMDIFNSIVWGNVDQGGTSSDESAQIDGVPSVHYSIVENWSAALGGLGNLGLDPQFSNPFGLDGVLGTLDDNLKLLPTSPGIDSGDNTEAPLDDLDLDDDLDLLEPIPFDNELKPRFTDTNTVDTGIGPAPVIDRGALEAVADKVCQANLGFQGPGAVELSICGDDLTQAGNTAVMRITNGAKNSPLLLIASVSASPTPSLGGTLVPFPMQLVIAGYFTNGAGQLIVPNIPGFGGPPVTVYVQAIVANGPIAEFSNALAVVIGT